MKKSTQRMGSVPRNEHVASGVLDAERPRTYPFDALVDALKVQRTSWEVVALNSPDNHVLEFFHEDEARPAYLWDVGGEQPASAAAISLTLTPRRERGNVEPAVVLYSALGFTAGAENHAREMAYRGGFSVYMLARRADGSAEHRPGKGRRPSDLQLVAMVEAALATEVPTTNAGAARPGQKGVISMESAWDGARILDFHTQCTLPARRRLLIESAKQSVWVSTYSFYDDDVIAALRVARKSASAIHLLLHAGGKDGVTRRNDELHRALAADNFDIYRVKMHAKCVVVDERFILLGSQNCSKSGKLEFTLEFDDERFGKFLVATLREQTSRASRAASPRKRKSEKRRTRSAGKA